MSGGSSWRSPSTADQYRHHDYADFAQEFLNRNASYRQDHADTLARIAEFPQTEQGEQEGLSRRWGLSFPTDPHASPRVNPALWSPDAAPDVVIIEAADPALAIPLPPGSEPLVEIATDGGRHVVVAHYTARLRLCVRHAPCLTVPSFLIPRDEACSLRLAAAARLQRATQGEHAPPDRSALPSAYQRARLVQLLHLQDALEAGASSRDLAFGLVFPNHRPLAGAMWKGSGEKRHVLRLIAEARRFITSGYRKLLLHR